VPLQHKQGLFLACAAYGTLCRFHQTAIFFRLFDGVAVAESTQATVADLRHNPL